MKLITYNTYFISTFELYYDTMNKDKILISLSISILIFSILFVYKIIVFYGIYLLISIVLLIFHCIVFFAVLLFIFNKKCTSNNIIILIGLIIVYISMDIIASCVVVTVQHGHFSQLCTVKNGESTYLDADVYLDSLFLKLGGSNISINPMFPNSINVTGTRFYGWINRTKFQTNIIEIYHNFETIFGTRFNITYEPKINLNVNIYRFDDYYGIVACYGLIYGVVFASIYFVIFVFLATRK